MEKSSKKAITEVPVPLKVIETYIFLVRGPTVMRDTDLPYVFTDEGVAMLSTVFNSERASKVDIAIMRAFVSLRELATTQKDLE